MQDSIKVIEDAYKKKILSNNQPDSYHHLSKEYALQIQDAFNRTRDYVLEIQKIITFKGEDDKGRPFILAESSPDQKRLWKWSNLAKINMVQNYKTNKIFNVK